MNIARRFTVIVAVALGLVPLSTVALLGALSQREQAREALQEVLDGAAAQYRARGGLSAARSRSERVATEGEKRLVEIAKKKRELRLKLARMQSLLGFTTGNAEQLLAEQARARETYALERERFAEFLRSVRRREESRIAGALSSGGAGRILLKRLFSESLGDGVATDLRDGQLIEARKEVMLRLLQAQDTAKVAELRMRASVGDLADDFDALQDELNSLQSEYRRTASAVDSARRSATLGEEQLAEIKRTVADVHDQVLQLQGELARIDARIRRRAERSLIEKGLLSGRPGAHSQGTVSGLTRFAWPVKGRITAPFHDAPYAEHFGVPHEGMDIAVAQGTAVKSAEDGVVFLVRDGGATGYTYVLVGHRDGYATLYGHLSVVSVKAGQDLDQGEMIGLSGGEPGTPGAGLMTTGQHLHFEVIKAGANIDPRTVLP